MISDKALYKQITKVFENIQDLKSAYNKAKVTNPAKAKSIAEKLNKEQQRFKLLNKKYNILRKFDAFKQHVHATIAKLDKQQKQLHDSIIKLSKQLRKTKDIKQKIAIRNQITSARNQINDIMTQKENLLDQVRLNDSKIDKFMDQIDGMLRKLGHKR
ncbi:MAG: hypothetical protein GXO10_06290 [Crenarchaeota archaeon]|nr:hypothetical protein [Thermoproteota archaeon]